MITEEKVSIFLRYLIIIFLGYVIGYHSYLFINPNYMWSAEDGGIIKMNESLQKDKSRRLALGVLTEKGSYTISSMTSDFSPVMGVVHGNEVKMFFDEAKDKK